MLTAKPSKVPPFTAEGSRHDLSTYSGRLAHFMAVTSPAALLVSDADVKNSQAVLQQYHDNHRTTTVDDGTMWRHRQLTDAAVHPATHELIPRLFRVSAIAPVNIPICYAMLTVPASNVPATLFLHWFNQSYNAACNYANRASAESQPWTQTAQAYALAVGSACAFAYGLGRLPFAARYGAAVPFAATAAANCSNVGFTRSAELLTGAAVRDAEGNVRGLSRVAGQQGVFQTALTRCVLVPAACLLFPPAAMAVLRRRKWLPTGTAALVAVELTTIYASLTAAMPAALAVFPQTMALDVNTLEPEFHGLKDSKGAAVTTLYANKGL